MYRVCWFVLTAVCVTFCSAIASAQEAPLDDLLARHSYRATLADGSFEGDAANFLVEQTARAQFVGFAEPHNVKQVPILFGQLFRALHEAHGFQFVALETGPVIMDRVSRPAARGRLEAIVEIFNRYPRSFHFYTDEELAMMAEVGSVSTATYAPVWGLDQVHAAPVVLDELIQHTTDGALRDRVRNLRDEVAQYNAGILSFQRSFIKLDRADLRELAAWYEPAPDSTAEFLIDQLVRSHRIYRNFVRAEAGEPTGYTSNVEREENMKSLFVRHYRAAHESEGSQPKVIVKQGHWHLLNGRSPGNAFTLGSFLREFAKSHEQEFFNIAVSVVNDPGEFWSLSETEDFAPLARLAPTDAITVFDLRPLRPVLHAGKIPEAGRKLRDWIYQYDAAMLIGGGSRGSYETSRARHRQRQQP